MRKNDRLNIKLCLFDVLFARVIAFILRELMLKNEHGIGERYD